MSACAITDDQDASGEIYNILNSSMLQMHLIIGHLTGFPESVNGCRQPKSGNPRSDTGEPEFRVRLADGANGPGNR